MPYNTTNHAKFVLATRVRWYNMESLVDFWEDMFSLKFRYEAERVEGADRIAAFLSTGKRGKEFFGYGTQFPATEADYYISTMNADLRTILENLHNVLTSVRSETSGKDVASVKTEDTSTKQIREQKAQDENKAYQAALAKLNKLAFAYDKYMSRDKFQEEYVLTWT